MGKMFYLICGLIGLAGLVSHFQLEASFTFEGATLFWGSGLVLLGYGLVRDIYLLAACPCEKLPPEQRKKSSMMCVESCIGFGLVALGLGLHWLGWTKMVEFSYGSLAIVASLILAFGHLTRNMVFILAEVPDHHNIVPTFRLHSAEETRALLDR
jgi:hypothetical protein